MAIITKTFLDEYHMTQLYLAASPTTPADGIHVVYPSTITFPSGNSLQMGITRVAGTPTQEEICLCSYYTAGIPTAATITACRLRWRIRSTTGSSTSWAIGFNIGKGWIGGSVDANDWWGIGSTALNDYIYGATPPLGFYEVALTPQATFIANINRTGYTDIRLRDNSAAGLASTIQQIDHVVAGLPQLEVDYDVNLTTHQTQQVAWTV